MVNLGQPFLLTHHPSVHTHKILENNRIGDKLASRFLKGTENNL